MKEIRQAIVLVDSHRRAERQRNTAGRYRVGAKTEKEAEKIVRQIIGFGSVKFYFWAESNNKYDVPYKVCVKEKFVDGVWVTEEPRHACSKTNEVSR